MTRQDIEPQIAQMNAEIKPLIRNQVNQDSFNR